MGNICRGGWGRERGGIRGGGVGWCLVEQLGLHTTRRGATPAVGRSCPARVRRDDTDRAVLAGNASDTARCLIESYRVSAARVPPTHRERQRARPCEYDVRYFLVGCVLSPSRHARDNSPVSIWKVLPLLPGNANSLFGDRASRARREAFEPVTEAWAPAGGSVSMRFGSGGKSSDISMKSATFHFLY